MRRGRLTFPRDAADCCGAVRTRLPVTLGADGRHVELAGARCGPPARAPLCRPRAIGFSRLITYAPRLQMRSACAIRSKVGLPMRATLAALNWSPVTRTTARSESAGRAIVGGRPSARSLHARPAPSARRERDETKGIPLLPGVSGARESERGGLFLRAPP